MKKHRMQYRLHNKGSSIIEITMLIPVFLGCIYFYIMLFLFFMESSKQMYVLSQSLYEIEERMEEKEIQKRGKMETVEICEKGKLFEIQMELNKDGSDPIENIRRWQLATGGI